jgi:signal transduction histidine kinase/ligand-binding sensor domain-containing protein
MRRLVGALVFFLHLCAAAANPLPLLSDYTHTAWGALQGAPTGVLRIVQSTDGWLWIASERGLYRYDGVQFERMQSVYGHRLESNRIFVLMAGADGALWVSYQNGAVSMFRKDGSRTFTTRDGLPADPVWDMHTAPDGAVWVATRKGALRLAPGAERFALQGGEVGLPPRLVLRLLFARDGTEWIASGTGVHFRRPGERRFQLAWQKETVINLAEGPDGSVWALADADQYHQVHAVAAGANDLPRRRLTAISMGFDREGAMWLLNRNEVERKRDPGARGDAAQRLTLAGGLSGSFPQPFFQDREGNIWIGTSSGLDRFRRNRLQPLPVSEELLFPTMIPTADGGMWISSYPEGVYRVNAAGGSELLAKDRFSVSHLAKDGTLWLAGGNGVRRRAPDGSVTDFAAPDGLRGLEARSIQQDSGGSLWVGFSGNGGLFRLVEGVWQKEGGLAGFPPDRPHVMATDAHGAVWMGHSGNAITIVVNQQGRTTLRHLGAASGLQVGSVLALFPDGLRMWAGGEDGTMLFREGRFVALRGARGEAFRGVSGIVRLANGELWLHGADGVYHIGAASLADWMRNPARPVGFERFDALDGLRGYAPQVGPFPSLVRAADGKLWFGTSNAVAVVDPAHIYRNALPPPVAIRSVAANDTVYEVEHRKALSLPEGTDSLRFAFTAPSLSIPERVRFRYRLQGVDHGWQDPVERRGASYTNLAPGRYRFEVSAANEDGVWSRLPAVLDVDIRPTFVQTRWFTLILALGAALMLYLAYALRVRTIRRRLQERHQAQLEERSRIARSLHDTLLQSVQGVLLSFDAHARRVPEGSSERTRLERTLDLAWKLMAEGRDQIMGLRASASPDELLVKLQPIGRNLAEHGGHAFELRTIGQARPLKPQVRDEMYAIGREALLNASRHAHAARVVLELDYGKDAFRLRVHDDGCGLEPAVADSQGRPGHWGLPGMRERAEGIAAAYRLSSDAGKGTEVMVSLPAALAYE